MIVKASRRGGGQQLATHLLNSYDNERIEIADVRGALAPDLHGAFAEWRAVLKATKAEKELYHLSVSPDPEQGRLTKEQYFDFLDRTEKKLGLDRQPRVVVFHAKKDKDGVPREHCHTVWSRIDAEKLRAISCSNDRYALRSIVREFARDYGLTLPDGIAKDRTPAERNAAKRHAENLQEKQQQERTGHTKDERERLITAAWRETKDGKSFIAALETHGYFLCRGTRKPVYMIVDRFGEAYALTRQIDGARKKDVDARLIDYPIDKLPAVDKARAFAKEQRAKAISPARDFAAAANKQRDALAAFHRKRREALDAKRVELEERHRTEMETLGEAQDAEIKGVTSDRLQKQSRGLKAFIARITGITFFTGRRQQREDAARGKQHIEQTAALQMRHEREQEDFQRHYRALEKIEHRESRSCETALRREQFLDIGKEFSEHTRDHRLTVDRLTPEFNRAAGQPEHERQRGNGKKGLSRTFDETVDRKPEPDKTPDERQPPSLLKKPRDPGRER